jgi:hypothetical protein
MAMNINDHPLLKQCYELCQAIEECGASPKLTDAVTKAGKVMTSVEELLEGIVSAQTISLSKDELEIIQKRRDEKAKAEFKIKYRIKALETARNYDVWLRENGRGSSYSTFVNEFGYEDDDSSFMYKVVKEILETADQF